MIPTPDKVDREEQILEGERPVANGEFDVVQIRPSSNNIQRYPLTGATVGNVFDVGNPKARVEKKYNPDTQASLSGQGTGSDVKNAETWDFIMTVALTE